MLTIKGKNRSENFVRMSFGTGKSLVLLFSGADDPVWLEKELPALLNREDGIPVKSSLFTTVLKFQNSRTGESFYFKEFHNRGVKDRLKNVFRVTRSKKAFMAGHLLLENGFLTPAPIMHGVEKTFCLIKKNFLVTREVPGERTYQYFEAHFQEPLSYETLSGKRALIEAAGHEIGRLHKTGIFHGDLRVGNIIINGTGSSARFFFIDNERTRYYKVIPKRKRLKNLVQLNMVLLSQIKRTDRLRFFNAYLMENPGLLPDKKKVIRMIQNRTEKRRRKACM